MLRLTPPLDAVEAFLAAARAPSFRAAAAKIALSPSAFSRRIQALEAFTGVTLFERTPQASTLTVAGQRYLTEIAPAIETIRRATLEFRGSEPTGPLRIATSHSLAAEWLMPRLGKLRDDLGLDVLITASRDPQLLSGGDVDLAIWASVNAPKRLLCEPLIALEGVFAAAPQPTAVLSRPASLDALRGIFQGQRILALRANLDQLEGLFDQLHLAAEDRPVPLLFETNQLAYEAAASGLGLVVAVPLLADRFIADGRLVPATAFKGATGCRYSAWFADHRAPQRQDIRRLIEWLRAEIDHSVARFGAWSDFERPMLASGRNRSPIIVSTTE